MKMPLFYCYIRYWMRRGVEDLTDRGDKMLKQQFPEILMETIFEDDEKVFNSICNGAEGYILKNTPPAQILNAIREI